MKYARRFLCMFCLLLAGLVSAGDMQEAETLFGKRQYKEALPRYLQLPSLQQNLKAQNRIGWIYHNAEGLIDYDRSVVWFKKAAEAGYPHAQYNLGMAYEDGKGVKQDYAQAMAWYQKAAAQDNRRAMYRLYTIYAYGKLGQPVDKDKAKFWKEKESAARKAEGARTNILIDQAFENRKRQNKSSAESAPSRVLEKN